MENFHVLLHTAAKLVESLIHKQLMKSLKHKMAIQEKLHTSFSSSVTPQMKVNEHRKASKIGFGKSVSAEIYNKNRIFMQHDCQ